MNSDTLSGKWHEIKGKVKETFGKLTDDDLTQIQGSSERIVGALQTRYGYGKDQAQQEWENFAKQHVITTENTYQEMADTANKTTDEGTSRVAKLAKGVADKVTNFTNKH